MEMNFRKILSTAKYCKVPGLCVSRRVQIGVGHGGDAPLGVVLKEASLATQRDIALIAFEPCLDVRPPLRHSSLVPALEARFAMAFGLS